jgi:ABC-2 type transport system permease protein
MKREMVRSLKIINQVIWPPVITTVLYVSIFGLALGSRIKMVQGVSYAEFLIPGLIMLQVIDSSYGECSSSVFQGRFMNSIQEMLIAPMSAGEMVFGYILGSLARALLIANMIMALGFLFVHTIPGNWWLYFFVMCIVSVLFSALGIIFGLMAEKFDHLAVLTTFAITPLVFVGGVFTSAQLLPPQLRSAELVNPMFYTIDAFRFSYTGQSYLPLWLSLTVIAAMMAVALSIALRMAYVGYKLRT